nr:hypothetical protein [Streptomyces sp. DSM 41633]
PGTTGSPYSAISAPTSASSAGDSNCREQYAPWPRMALSGQDETGERLSARNVKHVALIVNPSGTVSA